MIINKPLIPILFITLFLTSCASSQNGEKIRSLISPSSEPEVATTIESQPTEDIPQSSPNFEESEPKAITQSSSGITPQQLNRRVKQFTVRIDGVQNGSGVIIDESDNNYTVLTNWHVVQEPGAYTIQTSDGREHRVNYQQVQELAGVDLALVKFNSEQNYQIAEVGDSDYLSEGQSVHLAGYPGVKTNNDRIYRFYNLNIVSLLDTPINKGYSVLYEGETISGMSGSPLLDDKGNLVGIHGIYRVDDPAIRKGSSYAIPINTYKELVAEEPETTDTVASQQSPSPVAIKEDTKSVDNSITVSKKQTDNIIAHQEGQASEAIATQPGPDGMVVELLSTKVTGQILTVAFLFYNPEGGKVFSQPINQVNYIEDDTGKQVGVLQNEQGGYLASPGTPQRLKVHRSSDPSPVWIKFPVPSPETQTISINIPEVIPFDGVPIK